MSARSAITFVIAALCLLLLGTVVSAAEVRVPLGDSYLSPVNILLNGSKTITSVETATLEADLIDETTCDSDDDSTHSVWFGFTVDSGVTIDMGSAGTYYQTASYFATLAVMSLYEINGANLTHLACDSGYGTTIADAYLTAGSYVVRIAYEDSPPLTGPSQTRLSIRVRQFDGLMDDSQFDGPLGTQWKVVNDTNPAKIIRTCGVTCTVRFDGVAGGTIKNTVLLPGVLKVKVGDFLSFSGTFNGTPPAGANVKMKIKIVYSDGTPTTTASVVRNFTQTATGNAGFMSVGYFQAEIKSKAVSKVKLSITSPQATDTFNVWIAYLTLESGGIVRDNQPLALPVAAQ